MRNNMEALDLLLAYHWVGLNITRAFLKFVLLMHWADVECSSFLSSNVAWSTFFCLLIKTRYRGVSRQLESAHLPIGGEATNQTGTAKFILEAATLSTASSRCNWVLLKRKRSKLRSVGWASSERMYNSCFVASGLPQIPGQFEFHWAHCRIEK